MKFLPPLFALLGSMNCLADVVDPETDGILATATSVLVHGDAQSRPSPLPDPIVQAAQRWPALDVERPQ